MYKCAFDIKPARLPHSGCCARERGKNHRLNAPHVRYTTQRRLLITLPALYTKK